MKSVTIPKALLARFHWDERRQEYVALIPRGRQGEAATYARFRVEAQEGYVVLSPQ